MKRGIFPARTRALGVSAPGQGKIPLLAFLGLLLAAGSAGRLEAAAPVIDGFTATPTAVLPGGTATIRVTAHDPDCTTGTCTTGCGTYIRADLTGWSASGGAFTATRNGVSASPYAAEADWQAPAAEGSYTITVSVSDSGGVLCGGRQTTTTSLTVQVSTVLNLPPVIDVLAATPAQVFPGGTASLACRATDPDGDAVFYSWSATRGSVTPLAPGDATFVAGPAGPALVTCVAEDGRGGRAERTVTVAVTEAVAETRITQGLVTPQRLGVDSYGEVFVVDRGAGGIVVTQLGEGSLVYRLPAPDVTALAVDWADRLLVGRPGRAELWDHLGQPLGVLQAETGLGEVADVAVDLANRRYAVLYRWAGRVQLFDEGGALVGAFGSTGDGAAQLRTPGGLAFTPAGDVVVADGGHGLIKVFTPAGALIRSFGGPGGGLGEFVQLDDVEVLPDGVVVASDSYQSRLVVFGPDGTPLDAMGTYGTGLGQLATPAGLATAPGFDRLLAASLNGSSVQVFALTAAPPAPPVAEALLAPASLQFPDQAVGTVSGAQPVVIQNTGGAPLGVRSVAVTGEFEAVGCGPVVDPGASCALSVRFRPGAPGPREGSLTVELSAGGTRRVALAGTAYAPARLVTSAFSLVFPNQPVGTTSAPQPVRVLNGGTVTMPVAGLRTTGDFAQTSDCPPALGPGGSCTALVTFTPRTASPRLEGTLVVDASAVDAPRTLPLLGSSSGASLLCSHGDLDFGTVEVGQTSPSRILSFTASGTRNVVVGTVGLIGTNPGSFGLADDFCSGRTLVPGEVCTVAVVFKPVSAGSAVAALRLPSDADAAAPDVPLSGAGLAGAGAPIPAASPLGLALLALALALVGLRALRPGGLP